MKPRTFVWSAIGIAVGGLVLRVIYDLLLGHAPPVGSDGIWYALQAQTIAKGVGYVDPQRYFSFHGASPTAQFPPLWPTVLAGAHLVGLDTLRSYRIVAGVVGCTTVVLAAFIGRKLVGERVGLIAAVIVASSPFLIAADGSLMAESLFIALVTAAVLVAVYARETPSVWRFALLGLLLGLAALTRSDGLVIGVVLVAVTALFTPGAVVRRIAFAGLAVVVLIAVLVPWTIRNLDAFDKTVVLSNNSGSLIGGSNCGRVYGGSNTAGWDFECIVIVEKSTTNEVERAEIQREEGIRFAEDNIGRLAVVAPARVVRGWGIWDPTVLADVETLETRNRTMQLTAWPIELAILAVAVAGSVVSVRRKVKVAPLFAVIGSASFVLAASWGNQRFRLAAEPALAVLAAIAISAAWAAISRRREARAESGAGQERSGDTAAVQPLA